VSQVQPGSGGPAPGWYPDPFRVHQGRYWDGAAWTEHVDDHGQQSVDPPPPPADETVLELPVVTFQHEEIRWSDRPAQLGVFTGDDEQRQIAWVHYAAHRAQLTDMDLRPILSVGTTFGNIISHMPLAARPEGSMSRPGAVGRMSVWGPYGEQIASLTSHTKGFGGSYTFNVRGDAGGLKLRLNRGMRGELGATELIADVGTQIGAVVEYGRTQTGSIVASWLRLERAPGLAEPLRTLTTAAPLLLLTTFS
jgi:hypothetical protein